KKEGVAEPTLRERRWLRVGWEQVAANVSAGGSGFWMLDCDTNWLGIVEEDNLVPADAARVKLAKTMEERCEILKRIGATFYPSLEHYKSESTFLRAWEWKSEGEIGHLKKLEWKRQRENLNFNCCKIDGLLNADRYGQEGLRGAPRTASGDCEESCLLAPVKNLSTIFLSIKY
ncbi:MAG: hypothetical protein Q9181_004487, partial [Wetmoreana brouardii]